MYLNGQHLPFSVLQFVETVLNDAPPRMRNFKGWKPGQVEPIAYQLGNYRRGSRADFSPLDADDLIETMLALSPLIGLSAQFIAALPANYDRAIPPLLLDRLWLVRRVINRLIPLVEGLQPPPGTIGFYDLGSEY